MTAYLSDEAFENLVERLFDPENEPDQDRRASLRIRLVEAGISAESYRPDDEDDFVDLSGEAAKLISDEEAAPPTDAQLAAVEALIARADWDVEGDRIRAVVTLKDGHYVTKAGHPGALPAEQMAAILIGEAKIALAIQMAEAEAA